MRRTVVVRRRGGGCCAPLRSRVGAARFRRRRQWRPRSECLLVAASDCVVVGRNYRSWGYAERADDLLVTHGVLVRRLVVVPYGRMQLVDVTAGPVERKFGISTLRLHTASAGTDARIHGLEAPEAARLRDRLAALGESQSAGL